MRNTTTYGVNNLTDHMIRKYGMIDAARKLIREYGYTITNKKNVLKFTDSNKESAFYGKSRKRTFNA